ncbi:hypothetical protein KR074_009544, partial [Drosophila pseudoananassae]
LTVCEIKEIDEHRNMINIEGYLNKTVSQLEINFKMRKLNAAVWQPNAYDITVDVCQFFKNRALYVIPNLVFTFIKPYTNINHTCPYLVSGTIDCLYYSKICIIYKAGSKIRLWEYTLDDGGIMSKFPMDHGEYSGCVTWYINKVPSMTVNGSVTFF